MMNMPLNLTPPAINPNAEKVLSKRYYRKDENGQCVEDATGLFWRVASSVAAEEAKYEQSPWNPDALARCLLRHDDRLALPAQFAHADERGLRARSAFGLLRCSPSATPSK